MLPTFSLRARSELPVPQITITPSSRPATPLPSPSADSIISFWSQSEPLSRTTTQGSDIPLVAPGTRPFQSAPSTAKAKRGGRALTPKQMYLRILYAGSALGILAGAGFAIQNTVRSRRGPREDIDFGPGFNASFVGQQQQRWRLSSNRADALFMACNYSAKAARFDHGAAELRIVAADGDGYRADCASLAYARSVAQGEVSVAFQASAEDGVVSGATLFSKGVGVVDHVGIRITGANTDLAWATATINNFTYCRGIKLPFNATEAPHVYTVRVHSDSIQWLIDGESRWQMNGSLAQPTNMSLSIDTWLRNSGLWAGIYNTSAPVAETKSLFYWASYKPL